MPPPRVPEGLEAVDRDEPGALYAFTLEFSLKFALVDVPAYRTRGDMVKQLSTKGEDMATMAGVVYVGDTLKDLRIRKAWTQEQLAEKAGLGKNTVNRIEGNRTEPRMPTLSKLAKALGVDPAELVRNT